METNYAMMYEELVLAPWGGGGRRTDPFQLGDADTFRAVDNELSGRSGVDAKFGLFAAITKVLADNIDNENLVGNLNGLREDLSEASTLNDLCVTLKNTKTVFETVGHHIPY